MCLWDAQAVFYWRLTVAGRNQTVKGGENLKEQTLRAKEAVVEDIDYVFGKALINNTRYSKVHRQTVYLANRGMKNFYEEGFIIGNNSNRFNSKPAEKFPGV